MDKRPHPSPKLGEALVAAGVVSEKQLERALRVQARLEQRRQLGDVMVDLGYATKQQITGALSTHAGGMRLGEMLVEQGFITPDALDAALALQKDKGIRLGTALIELGAINERTLLRNLAHQARVPYVEPAFAAVDQELFVPVSPKYLEKHCFVPFHRAEDGRVCVVVTDLDNKAVIRAIEDLYQNEFTLALGPEDAVRSTIEDAIQFRQQEVRKGGAADAGADPITHMVDHILRQAIVERASDIHIEPMSDKIRIRYRIDGALVYKTDLPKDLLLRIVSRIKIMAETDIAEHRRHQGGRLMFHVGAEEYDLRLSVYVTVHGPCVVMRILNKRSGVIGLDELGMNPAMRERYRLEVLDPPTGVVLITGPTGSGKTTTLYSSLDHCNTIEAKIITVEDPVEYMIDGLIQCSVQDPIGRTFESSLREIVRQDPDIIVLGEIRDRTSAETAIQAALTGHKVYSTFHTEDTIGGLLRLMNMDIEAFLISSTVISILAQRLLRRICPKCEAPASPAPLLLRQLDVDPAEARGYEFKRGRGCRHCNFTGYRGRIAIYELLVLNEVVKDAILHKMTAHEIRRISIETTGLVSMREDGTAKAIRGFTTLEEVVKQAPRTSHMRPLRQILAMTQ